MAAIKRRHTSDKQKVAAIRGFLNLAFKDYIAARTLLNFDLADLALQGAILASTCIEKYFKAIISLRGNNTGKHLNSALMNSIENYDSALYGSLNSSFLGFLQKCYQLRYLDTLPVGFTIGITSLEVLAELDFTVDKIQKRFRFESDGVPLKFFYDAYMQDKNHLLYDNNYILLGLDKSKFVEHEVSRYAMIFDESRGLVEVFYQTMGSSTVDFLAPGLIPNSEQ